MKDNARIEKGELIIDVGELVDNLSQDQKDELAKTAAFKDAYSRTIVQLICEDATEDGWSVWSTGGNPLTKARIAILERLGDVEREVIRDLLDKKAAAQANEKRMEQAYYDIRNWASNHKCEHCAKWNSHPKRPDFVSGGRVTDADIDVVASSRDLLAASLEILEMLIGEWGQDQMEKHHSRFIDAIAGAQGKSSGSQLIEENEKLKMAAAGWR